MPAKTQGGTAATICDRLSARPSRPGPGLWLPERHSKQSSRQVTDTSQFPTSQVNFLKLHWPSRANVDKLVDGETKTDISSLRETEGQVQS